jgi:hypothetical protein
MYNGPMRGETVETAIKAFVYRLFGLMGTKVCSCSNNKWNQRIYCNPKKQDGKVETVVMVREDL